MRRRLEALALGIRRSALGPVFALSGLTLRESVRKKVFLVVAVFTLVMLGAIAMLPAIRPEDRVPLIETWAQRAIMFFGVMIAVFLAGVSLPEDIEEKKIFTLLSKPLTRWQLLAGRFVGFASLLALFGLAGGVICAVIIRIVAAGGTSALANTTEYLPAEIRTKEWAPGSETVAISNAEQPLRLELGGAGQNIAIFFFRGLDLDDLPDPVPMRVKLDINAQELLRFGEVDVFLKALDQKVDDQAARKHGWMPGWDEPPQPDQPPPRRLASRRVTAKTMVEAELPVPKAWFDDSGSLDVGIARAKTDLRMGFSRDSVRMVSAPHNFEWNFAKALVSTFLLWVVVLAMTLAGSTVLSGPVNLLFGIAVFITGSMIGFLRESLPSVEATVQQAEHEEAEAGEHGHDDHDHGDDELPIWVLKFSGMVSRRVIDVVPDLQVYDASLPILKGHDVPMSRLAEAARTAFGYALGAFLVGLAFLRMREFR